MKVNFEIQKKHLFVLTALVVLIAGVFLVRSYDSAQGWHSASQIDFSAGITGPLSVNGNIATTGTGGISSSQGITAVNDISGGRIYAANGKIGMGSDPNPWIELKGAETPYIDFANDAGTDYDARLILANDNTLEVFGATLKAAENLIVTGTSTIGYERLSYTSSGYTVYKLCSSGKKVIGGGCTKTGTVYALIGNSPMVSSEGWECKSTGNEQITVYVICARVA